MATQSSYDLRPLESRSSTQRKTLASAFAIYLTYWKGIP